MVELDPTPATAANVERETSPFPNILPLLEMISLFSVRMGREMCLFGQVPPSANGLSTLSPELLPLGRIRVMVAGLLVLQPQFESESNSAMDNLIQAFN
jgi:hypothetical protein